LQGIRTVLDSIAQTQKGSNALPTYDLTPGLNTESNLRYANLNDYSSGHVHRGNLRDGAGHPTSNCLLAGVERLLSWPKVIEFLGEPVVKKSFILECNLDTAGLAPDGQSTKYGIREDDFLTLCRNFLDYVHVRNPLLEPSGLEQYAKESAELFAYILTPSRHSNYIF
jgi:hypothetical protein